MKSIIIYILSFSFFLTACISEKVVDTQNSEKGSVSISLDKNNSPKDIVRVIVILERDGFETIQKSINLLDISGASFSSTDLPAGIWHIIVQTFNKDNEILYSGETDISIQPDFSISVFLQFDVNTGNLTFNISLGETNTDNLIALYPFYGNANDLSGNNNGIVEGATLVTDRFGNKKSAYYFDGVDDYIRIPDNTSLTPINQQLTIASWIKNEGSRNKFILYKGNSYNNREYSMGISENALAGFSINNNGMWHEDQFGINSELIINDNEWYFLVGVWDGTEMKMYINGKLENSKVVSATIGNFDSDLFIGTYGGDIQQYAFRGIIDDIAIFNKPLSATEIEQIYHATK